MAHSGRWRHDESCNHLKARCWSSSSEYSLPYQSRGCEASPKPLVHRLLPPLMARVHGVSPPLLKSDSTPHRHTGFSAAPGSLDGSFKTAHTLFPCIYKKNIAFFVRFVNLFLLWIKFFTAVCGFLYPPPRIFRAKR